MPKKEVYFPFRMSKETKQVLKRLAAKEKISEAEWIRRRIAEHKEKRRRNLEKLQLEMDKMALETKQIRRSFARIEIKMKQRILTSSNDELGRYLYFDSIPSNAQQIFVAKDYNSQTSMFENWKRKELERLKHEAPYFVARARKLGLTLWEALLKDYKKDLQSQILKLQMEVGPFECPYCDHDLFDTREALEAHIKKAHPKASEAKICLCPYCEQTFPSKTKLSAHVKTEHPEKWNAYCNGWRVGGKR